MCSGYKIKQKSVAFLYANNRISKKEMKKNLISKSIKKNKIDSNTFNQRGERSVHRKL